MENIDWQITKNPKVKDEIMNSVNNKCIKTDIFYPVTILDKI